jgi:hypothetical protein
MKLLANSWFRTGSSYTSNGICEFIKETAAMLPSTVEKVFFRADSGFFCGELFDLLEELTYDYLVKVKLYNNIKKILRDNVKWQSYRGSNEMSIGEFDFKGRYWKKARKLKVIRTLKVMKEEEFFDTVILVPDYEYAVYCSSLDLNAFELHEKYKERSTSETWIEQVKTQLLAGKTLTDDFNTNDMIWQLNVFSYNLSVMMRFKWKKFWREEHATFRDWFIEVPAILKKGGNQVVMKIYENFYFKRKWEEFEQLLLQ